MREQKMAIQAAAAHDAFLSKIGSKISIVGRDGSQTFLGGQATQSTSLMKPLKSRNLPVLAEKYRPKTPRNVDPKSSNAPSIPSKYLPDDDLKGQNPIERALNEVAQDPPISKIPTPTLTLVRQKPSLEKNKDVMEGSILGLERREEAPPKNIPAVRPRDRSQLEKMALKKISESPIWGLDLLRSLTRIIEPVYAARLLRDTVKNDVPYSPQEYNQYQSEDSQTNLYSKITYNFNTKAYDNTLPIPGAGLFFTCPSVEQKQHATHQKKQREKDNAPLTISRPASTYSELYKLKSGIASNRSGTPKRTFVDLCGKEKFEPEPEVKVPNNQVADLFVENDNELEEALSKSFFEVVTVDQQPSQVVRNESRHSMNTISAESSNNSDSSDNSNSKQSQMRFKPAFFPPADVKLGGLGPDRDSESYLSKMEKVRKQKQYSELIRKRNFVKNTTPKPNTEKEDSAFSSSIVKLPSISNNTVSVIESLTKNQKMKKYAKNVKKPTINNMRGSSKSLPELKGLPPIGRVRNLSAPDLLDSPNTTLMRLEQEHQTDLKIVEEIRRFYKQ